MNTPQPSPSQGADAELDDWITRFRGAQVEPSPIESWESFKAELQARERRLVRAARIDELENLSGILDYASNIENRIAQLQAEGE
jgi:hypothetical protein